jgi:hypothetical protein
VVQPLGEGDHLRGRFRAQFVAHQRFIRTAVLNGGRAAGRMVWHIDGKSGYVFRAHRIHSLYQPGVGEAR